MHMQRASVRFFFCVLLFLILAIPVSGRAVETTSVGEGKTRQEAINNGLRAAVEQVSGTLIKSGTQVSKGKLVWDKIASASSGIIKSYRVNSEGKDPITDVYEVRMTVDVDDRKLKDAMEDVLDDPRKTQIIQKTDFDNKRVVVLYKPMTGFDLPYKSKGVQTIMGYLQDALTQYGFRVFLPEQLKKIDNRLAETIVDEETAINLARQEAGDFAVVVSLDAAKKPTEDGYYVIMSTLTMKAYDVSTGAFSASVQNRGKTNSRQGDYAIQDAIARVAIKIGGEAAKSLAKKIYAKSVGPKFIELVFTNISPENGSKIEDILMDLGWETRVEQTGTYIKFEVIGQADATTVRRILKKEIRKAGLPLICTGIKSDRVDFKGKATGGFN